MGQEAHGQKKDRFAANWKKFKRVQKQKQNNLPLGSFPS